MTALVVYSSRTGNTEKIARAIASVLPDAKLTSVEMAPDPAFFDRVFVGFWCDKGQIDEVAMNFMRNLPAQEIYLFGTLGSDPQGARGRAFFQRVLESVPLPLKVRDLRLWQGKIDPAVIERMSRMPGASPMSEERKRQLSKAQKHPTSEDCQEARDWAKSFFEKDNT